MIQSDSTPASPTTTRARPVMIPWRDVARRLAEGEKPSVVAAGLAIDEDRIWRHLRKSLRFRTYLRQAVERRKHLADLLLEGTGRSAMVALGASIIGNALWNRASQLMPLTMLGQMIVFETLFALIYGFVFEGRWPTGIEVVACVLMVIAILETTARRKLKR